MSPLETGLAGFVALLVLVGLRAPVGLALGLVGIAGVWYLRGLDTAIFVLGTAPIEALSSYTLSVLPLFILMGGLAVRIGLAEGLFRGAYGLAGHRPGGLAIASIIACGGFGAVCGSSLATVSTMAKISVPEMLRYGYSPKLATGSVAAGGTLGILIPPSLPMIIYAFLTETSLGKLFAAGFLPGLLAIALYVGATVIWMHFRPDLGPAGERRSWRERVAMARDIWGVGFIFVVVIGGILVGLFSPTEGAAVGAGAALVLGLALRRIDWRGIAAAAMETVELTTMILFIVVGVAAFDFFMSAAQMPELMAHTIQQLDYPPAVVMTGIIVFLILLGCVLDAIAILFIATPVLFPIVLQFGYDPVWFGIIMIMVIEFGVLTPPIGMNVFVISKMVPEVTTWGAFQGVAPYIGADVIRIGLLILFPGIVLLLPAMLFP